MGSNQTLFDYFAFGYMTTELGLNFIKKYVPPLISSSGMTDFNKHMLYM